MRVEGFFPVPYSTDRTGRTGSTASGYGETQRAAQAQREVDSRSSGQDYQPQSARPQQRVNQAALVERYSAFRYNETQTERPLPTRVAQALASYSYTASLPSDFDTAEVLGLDLYA
ncbi:hypothetical protein N8H22_11310 [Stutzerimonas stutzeri]|uniref:hypothetical protein n=1 Tax=Stutzerimonas sp. S1 TaxID=3030652 RepID=UPI0022259BD0|nr:hypothetical protein [Stutzerimonas sp. S1]MCW3149183.1 hypothetical protein [Stutzerimonas sp. S1]